ncbi:MAG: anaerobic ribonucleoside-triphosphate reductase activating protein [Erysipelotrichaceae bacterium]|nr:anaerobic ribonucleoside-triphosphate reductase activating protein [Erysipelotrichaceae bacterium]
MKIVDYKPLTLIDYPNKVASIGFTSGCDLRCPYCHNPSLVLSDQSDGVDLTESFLFYLKQRKDLLDGVVISGGEPLLHKDIEFLLLSIKKLGLMIKLDTNGNHPVLLKKLLDNRMIDHVALDHKNIENKIAMTCGLTIARHIKDYRINWKASIENLRNSEIEYEIRTTIVKEFHDIKNLREMANMLRSNEIWYLQNFRRSKELLVDRLVVNDQSLTGFSNNELSEMIIDIQKVHEKTFVR